MRSKKVRAAMIAAAAWQPVIPDLRRRQTETGIITTTDRK